MQLLLWNNMINLFTEMKSERIGIEISLADRVLVIGSCFADEIGAKMTAGGFNVMVNPFGTLYNPASIAKAFNWLEGSREFSEKDCVMMGAGADRWCSFMHHTSFSRESLPEFLENANASLAQARDFWKKCNKVIITLGTSYVWEHEEYGIVANCLKRNNKEFTHRRLSAFESTGFLEEIMGVCENREVVFTVSPIRHLSQGFHENTLSKAALHLAVDAILSAHGNTAYFPSYELLNDSLRDYRFYAEDLVHPSKTAISLIWEYFLKCTVPEDEHGIVELAEKTNKQRLHKRFFK